MASRHQITVSVRAVTRYIINVHTDSEEFGERHVRDEQHGGEIANLDDANRMADAYAHIEARDNPGYGVTLTTIEHRLKETGGATHVKAELVERVVQPVAAAPRSE